MTFFRTIALSALAAGMCLGSLNAYAGENLSGRKVLDVGCHNNAATCFVDLDGPPFGSTLGCSVSSTSQFRFDNGDTSIGKRTFAAFLAAYLTGKHVSVYLEGCAGGWPTVAYFYVTD